MDKIKTINAFPAGVITMPPSKSLSHRALICAALAAAGGAGASTLYDVGDSDDIRVTSACMSAFGATFERSGGTVHLRPAGRRTEMPVMDCGESGSTLRFILPLAAALGTAPVRFAGKGRLMERPLEVYEHLFAEKGARFERQNGELVVCGPLPSGQYTLPGDVSSQFVSGLLFALPLLQGDSRITLSTHLESAAYVNLTLDVLEQFGITIHRPSTTTFEIPGGQHYQPQQYTVGKDYSQAAFFLVAGALGRPVLCAGMDPRSRQGDAAVLDILTRMGATVKWNGDAVSATATQLNATDMDVREIPDLVPPLAVLCSFANGTSRIVGAARLRLKESDRLAAMAGELRKLGAVVQEGADSLTITGRPMLDGGQVDAHGDHRIAMAMAVAAIRCQGAVSLSGWQHVNKSYPHFWQDFEKEAVHG